MPNQNMHYNFCQHPIYIVYLENHAPTNEKYYIINVFKQAGPYSSTLIDY